MTIKGVSDFIIQTNNQFAQNVVTFAMNYVALKKGVCKCAAGQYLEADDWYTFENARCETCPPTPNSVAGAATVNMCTCNVGFEGPSGGPCTVIKYPTAGCAAGYWAPPNQCKPEDYAPTQFGHIEDELLADCGAS